MMNEPLVSIIVPIYNVSKYLDKCIYSIVNQTYTELEILLIDDGSTDSSLNICKKWGKKDSRIEIYTKKNEGLGPTRNYGIDRSHGEYLAFIDSDDWWENDAVELLVTNAQLNNADMVYMNFFWEEQKDNLCFSREYCQQCLFEGCSNSDEHPDLIFSKDARTWSKFYRKSLFIDNNIHFPAHPFEDFPINPILVIKANRISQVHKPLYHYRVNREGNITGQSESYGYVTKGLEELEESLRDIGYYEKLKSQFESYSIQLMREFINGGVSKKIGDQILDFLNAKYLESMKMYNKRIWYTGSYAGLVFIARNLFHGQIFTSNISNIPQNVKLEIECKNILDNNVCNYDYFIIDLLDIDYVDEQIQRLKDLIDKKENEGKKVILLELLWAERFGVSVEDACYFKNIDDIRCINSRIINKINEVKNIFGNRCIGVCFSEEERYTYVNTAYGCIGKYYNNNYYKNEFVKIQKIIGA